MMIHKAVRLGTTDLGSVWVFINYNGKRLSITSVEGPLKSGNARGGGGQHYDCLLAIGKYSKGITQSMVRRLYDVWQRWHLNDMRAGCHHQEATNPRPEIGSACNVCGYKYGSAWNYESVPDDALAFLDSIPASDVPAYNAWFREYQR